MEQGTYVIIDSPRPDDTHPIMTTPALMNVSGSQSTRIYSEAAQTDQVKEVDIGASTETNRVKIPTPPSSPGFAEIMRRTGSKARLRRKASNNRLAKEDDTDLGESSL